jgi:DNA-binding FadR family transcriptional regulator
VTNEDFNTTSSPRLAQLIADTVRDQVHRGVLQPGDRLPTEATLVRQFGVSRPTLREALRMLERDELIYVRRGTRGGASVRVPGVRPLARAIADLSLRRSGGPDDAASFAELDDDDLHRLLRTIQAALSERSQRPRHVA